MPINEFKAISTFAKAVELGSIRQAALAQGVTPQAASQTIAQLEQHLGVRLLHRTTRNLALTEEGVVRHAKQCLDTRCAADSRAASRPPLTKTAALATPAARRSRASNHIEPKADSSRAMLTVHRLKLSR